jgi:hypothetical protein
VSLAVRVEDVMTPRTMLRFGRNDAAASRIADDMRFDVVPLTREDGKVLEFWSRLEQKRLRIRRIHRTSHVASIESILIQLSKHVVQFVYYRSEVVGLVDASDLNRPVARIAWLQPMLELERAILDAVRKLEIGDDEQAIALGDALNPARKRQNKAKRASLELPLVEYAQFPDLLRAARRLQLLALDDKQIESLNRFRRRAAHSGDVAVDSRFDCAHLREAIGMARSFTRQVSSIKKRSVERT